VCVAFCVVCFFLPKQTPTLRTRYDLWILLGHIQDKYFDLGFLELS